MCAPSSRGICAACLCLFFLATSTFAQQVAVTFDDLPAHGPLPAGVTRVDVARSILKTLREARVPKVYGFVNASKLEQTPADMEVLRLWKDAGFPLGNHTYSHMSLNAATTAEFERNIVANEPVLKSLMGGKDWHWFRYPYLWEGDTLEKRREVRTYLKEHKYRIAQVTLDFEDYLWNPPYARCLEKNDAAAIDWLKTSYMSTAADYIAYGQAAAKIIYGRDIRHVLLLHIGGFETVMLPQLLDSLKRRGFRFITLAEAEKDSAYKSDPDAALKEGGTLLEQMLAARRLDLSAAHDKPYDKLNTLCR
jgi:peptidoglycan/xylan/chitin deacetylase (PgdA/CDA1 family)